MALTKFWLTLACVTLVLADIPYVEASHHRYVKNVPPRQYWAQDLEGENTHNYRERQADGDFLPAILYHISQPVRCRCRDGSRNCLCSRPKPHEVRNGDVNNYGIGFGNWWLTEPNIARLLATNGI